MDLLKVCRFWQAVNFDGPSHINTNCWTWMGHLNDDGYGKFRINVGGSPKFKLAHIVSWYLNTGIWPSKLCLHRCDIPACVRFDHLWLGSQKDNMRDCLTKGRFPIGAKHGMRLHPERNGMILHPETNASRKLSQTQVDEILNLYGPGIRQVDLAKQFNVSQRRISQIIRGE